jgi:hypothetical protein
MSSMLVPFTHGQRLSWAVKWLVSASVVSQKSLNNRGGLLSGFERGGTGARGHRNEMVPPGPNRRKPHSRGRGGGHQAAGLLTTGARHAPLEAIVKKR